MTIRHHMTKLSFTRADQPVALYNYQPNKQANQSNMIYNPQGHNTSILMFLLPLFFPKYSHSSVPSFGLIECEAYFINDFPNNGVSPKLKTGDRTQTWRPREAVNVCGQEMLERLNVRVELIIVRGELRSFIPVYIHELDDQPQARILGSKRSPKLREQHLRSVTNRKAPTKTLS